MEGKEEEEEEEEEEEVIAEVEAMKAVYGTDCLLIRSLPPHFHISLKPRTADVSSEQFVEVVLEVRASPQYPKEPPSVDFVDCKGLDGQRQKHLLNYIQSKASELSPCLMLVALCEEAAEKLSAMNHPDGDCPLCLFPLVPEDHQSETMPFMKLMSCFHCFHSECIIRWWNWLQSSKQTGSANSNNAAARRNHDNYAKMEEGDGNCPVCRKPFHAKDLDHVIDLVDSHSSRSGLDNDKGDDEEKILQSDHEIIRRHKFEAILSLQKENSGLIEPKKDIVILPGMYLPQPVAVPGSLATKELDATEQHEKDPPSAVGSGKHGSGTSNGPSSSRNGNFGVRRHRERNEHHHSSSTGMYLPQPVAVPGSSATKESDATEQQERDPPAAAGSGKHGSGTSNGPNSNRNKSFGARRHRERSEHHHSSSTDMHRPQPVAVPGSSATKESDVTEQQERDPPAAVGLEKHDSGTSIGPNYSGNKNLGPRRHRERNEHHHSSSTARHPRKPVQQQWVARDNSSSKQ